MRSVLLSIVFLLSLILCFSQSRIQNSIFLDTLKSETIENRIQPPAGFQRISVEPNSFAAWLRKLPLLPANSPVKDYKNRIFKKSADSTVAAVVAYDIRGKKLDQCMDILLRFYSQYFIENGKSNDIRFPMPDGLILSWADWTAGNRLYFKGLHFYLKKTARPDSSFHNFQSYLNTLFEYSGTQAFYHYYRSIPLSELEIGDFIVKKGDKSHAVMIVDLAQNAASQLIALFGQGDTPACQFYLLKQPDGNPWFPIDPNNATPALPIKKIMYWDGLRRFGEKPKN